MSASEPPESASALAKFSLARSPSPSLSRDYAKFLRAAKKLGILERAAEYAFAAPA